jgi:hypothetical protein
MTDLAAGPAVGRDLARRDGWAKITGTAPYAYEAPVERPLYCAPIQATIARGTVTAMLTDAAAAVDGVAVVLTVTDAERLASTEDAELAILQGPQVAFRGQIIGAAVAESPHAAREAADLVETTYQVEDADVALRADHPALYKPEKVNPAFPTDTEQGDLDHAMAVSDVTVARTYTTPMLHNNPLELGLAERRRRPDLDHACVVDQHVQASEPGRRDVDQPCHVGAVAHIGHDREHIDAGSVQFGFRFDQIVTGSGADDDVEVTTGELTCQQQTQPPAGTSDEGDLAVSCRARAFCGASVHRALRVPCRVRSLFAECPATTVPCTARQRRGPRDGQGGIRGRRRWVPTTRYFPRLGEQCSCDDTDRVQLRAGGVGNDHACLDTAEQVVQYSVTDAFAGQ